MNLNKISKVFIILISLWFIVNSAVRYFLLSNFSLQRFIVATSFFSICAITSFLSLFGKISFFEDIINRRDNKKLDILNGILGLFFGITGFYMWAHFEMDDLKKVFLFYGSIIFSVMAIAYLLIKLFGNTRKS